MRMNRTTLIAMIVLAPIAMVVGLMVGRSAPMLAFLFLVALMGFVAWILMANKQGAAATAAQREAALAITPTPGRARIYVMREGFVAGMQGMNITVDEAWKGQIRSKFFMMAEVMPGLHRIGARFNKQGTKSPEFYEVELAEGQFVLLNIGLEMGMMAGKPYYTRIDDGVAIRQKLAGLKMVNWIEQPA
jgi:hypothetical protein